MSETLRALVIGCGKVGGGYNTGPDDAMVLTHALAYARHPSYVLAGCVDPDRHARSEFVAKWNAGSAYRSLDEAFAAEDFDVASVCTPSGTHLLILSQLLDSGVKAVFAEKPLDGNVAGAIEIGAKFAVKSIPVAVNFTRRFDPVVQELKAAFASGNLGCLRSVTGWYGRGVLNNGSHLLDLVAFLTGSVPKLVSLSSVRNDGLSSDPTVSAALDVGGVPLQLVGVDGADFSRFEIEFAFSDCILVLEEGGLSIRTRRVAASSHFSGAKVADRGTWQPTRYGEAMLVALDELKGWRSAASLSSDIASAIPSIDLADRIRLHALVQMEDTMSRGGKV